jgi:hypothetical protein
VLTKVNQRTQPDANLAGVESNDRLCGLYFAGREGKDVFHYDVVDLIAPDRQPISRRNSLSTGGVTFDILLLALAGANFYNPPSGK